MKTSTAPMTRIICVTFDEWGCDHAAEIELLPDVLTAAAVALMPVIRVLPPPLQTVRPV